jgi:predicted RND superfamily exporter protein
MEKFVAILSFILFSRRRLLLAVFTLITLVLGGFATQLRVDAGFAKSIPLKHPYMQTFTQYQGTFGGANRVLIAVTSKRGDIYSAEFMAALKGVTDELFFLPGIERPSVVSLFTPNARYIEIIEDGFAGGSIVPGTYQGTAEDLVKVRENVLKSGEVGRLVANDMKGALVRAELQELDPATGQRLDYAAVARQLEQIRAKFQNDAVDVHIIGFAKAIGDISDGARGVLMFFLIAFVITTILLYFYSNSLKLTGLALFIALLPVLWLLGLLPLLGYGIDPLSILVPFLIFSIGVSHAVQMTNAWKIDYLQGADSLTAAQDAFLKLFIPGALALLANALGFLVIMMIEIDIVRELGITASLGVLLMIITNKMLLPILLSYTQIQRTADSTGHATHHDSRFAGLWDAIARLAERRRALGVLAITLIVLVVGGWQARHVKTGDLGQGLPELHDDSRYNRDNATITSRFSIGVDVLSVIAQTRNAGQAPCLDHEVMDAIDRFNWHMRNIDGVHSILSLPDVSRRVATAVNEGNLKWNALPRNPQALAQSIGPVDTSSGLINTDCSAMQLLLFTEDHQGTTIARIVREIKAYAAAHPSAKVEFKLASGNVGVMAATNEAVDAAEYQMLIALFVAISLMCLLAFRSLAATLCIILPLGLVSILCNALMAQLGIGLKVSTLPVIALGVGVGVDYGIYLYAYLRTHLDAGLSLPDAFAQALRQRGTAIAFTAITMSLGVATWAFSALKFQADMGILLAFMFLVNMFGAMLLLPALSAWLLPRSQVRQG